MIARMVNTVAFELARVEEVVDAVRIKEMMIAQGSDPAFLLGDGE